MNRSHDNDENEAFDSQVKKIIKLLSQIIEK